MITSNWKLHKLSNGTQTLHIVETLDNNSRAPFIIREPGKEARNYTRQMARQIWSDYRAQGYSKA